MAQIESIERASAADDRRAALTPDPRRDDDDRVRWIVVEAAAHWRVFLIGAVAGMAIAGAAAMFTETLYEGVATIMVSPPRATEEGVIASAVPLTGFRALFETNTLASEVIGGLHLDQAPWNLTPARFVSRVLAVEEVRGANLLRIRVKLHDPALAATAANTVAERGVNMSRELDVQQFDLLQGQLKTQLEAATTQLRSAEQRLGDYRREAQVELTKADTEARLDQRSELLRLTLDIETERARITAATAELKKQSPILGAKRSVGIERSMFRQADLDRGISAPVPPPRPRQEPSPRPNVDPNVVLPPRQDGATPIEPRSSDAPLIDPGPAVGEIDPNEEYVNPVYQVLSYQIATSTTKLAALENRRRELVNVLGIGGDAMRQLTELHQKQLELARRETDYTLAKTAYSDLFVKYQQARSRGVTNSATLQMIDRALVPEAPAWPKPTLFIATGLLLGLIGAAMVVSVLALRRAVR